MMNVGLGVLVAAVAMALFGVVGYATARRSTSRSRGAALTIFGHGTLVSSAILFTSMIFHVHSTVPLSIHIHPADEAMASIFECDLDVSCVMLTIGLITFLVLSATFLIAQLSVRMLRHRLLRNAQPDAAERLRRMLGDVPGAELIVVREPAPDAFSFALLRADRRRIAGVASVVVVTEGLVNLLEPEELRAVVGHELAHVQARDDRYLPFFRTLSALMFFDPVLRALHRRVSRRHEFEADRVAAERTGRPLDLARALLKVYINDRPAFSAAVGFASRTRSELLERIDALIALEARRKETIRRGGRPSG